MINNSFWKNKKILITGNTGFKGVWLTKILLLLGSKVFGYSDADKYNNIKKFDVNNVNFRQYFGNILNLKQLHKIIMKEKPSIIFHLAAQSLVFKSYLNPLQTFEVNFNGTLNILNEVKNNNFIKSAIFVTSDKCYKPVSNIKYFDENSQLGGIDPYSASKSCAEILINSYIQSYKNMPISTVRAGNVIGGGDWNEKRLIPDIIRSIYIHKKNFFYLRNKQAVRPWQHVLEPLIGYILLSEKIYKYKDDIYRDAWNFGPSKKYHKNVKYIIDYSNKLFNKKLKIKNYKYKFKEENFIFLNSKKSRKYLNWKCILGLDKSLEMTIYWYQEFYNNKKGISNFTNSQIEKYLDLIN